MPDNYYCSQLPTVHQSPDGRIIYGYFHPVVCSLWSPWWNRADHYIFALWFLLSFFFSSPNLSRRRLMSTILPHMVWPQCEFKMQVWNLLHAARWKYTTQKSRHKSPSGHHRTTLSGYIFTTKACIDNWKKNLLSSNISSRCPHNMVNFGELVAEIDPVVWGTPVNFNGFRVLAVLLHGI